MCGIAGMAMGLRAASMIIRLLRAEGLSRNPQPGKVDPQRGGRVWESRPRVR